MLEYIVEFKNVVHEKTRINTICVLATDSHAIGVQHNFPEEYSKES